MDIVYSQTDPTKKYQIDLKKQFCTCPAWKYQTLPPSERVCKHLIEAGVDKPRQVPGTARKNRRSDLRFLLVAEGHQIKTDFLFDSNWWLSQKYNGVRGMFVHNKLYTRSGNLVPAKLIRNFNDFSEDRVYDGELVTCDVNDTSHTKVMSCINTQKLDSLIFLAFDDITNENKSFVERYDRLLQVPANSRVMYYTFRNKMSYTDILQSVVRDVQKCLNWEGIVMRNVHAKYTHKRDVMASVKIK